VSPASGPHEDGTLTSRRGWWVPILVSVAIVVAIPLALWGVWSWKRPDLAPHARQDAAAAKADPIWEHEPDSFDGVDRWAILQGPEWFSWGNEHTTVGRRYHTDESVAEVLDAWHAAALASGWEYDGASCDRANDEGQLKYSKTLDGRRAMLTVTKTYVDNEVVVNVTLPVMQGDSGFGATGDETIRTACR